MTRTSTGNSRRRFLEQAGITLAAGLGVAVATTVPAQASVAFTCCPSSCKSCSGTGVRAFNCVNSSSCRYCSCYSHPASCFNTTQPSCP